MGKIVHFLGFILLFVLAQAALSAEKAENPGQQSIADVRVLIDVSGSMKKNDPAKLRIPALKLLVNLLPPDSRAEIWLFAGESKPLVALGNVDADWKQRALDSASKIHSRGLFTNIEVALDSAMKNWDVEPNSERRSILFLTDGVVDVAKDPNASLASRQAILDQLLPRLQGLSVNVHSVALSANADHELLKKLSFDTGGWSQSVESAEQLERAFWKMFKHAVPRDQVPLTDNRFTIDAGIDEFSLLVFRRPGAAPTQLLDPAGKEINQDDPNAQLKWHHETGYDLITIEKPASGEWQLVADVDPDNQVMVVTDLKLEMTDMPSYATEMEALTVRACITEKSKPIANADFLKLVKIQLHQVDDLGRNRDWDMPADRDRPGCFAQPIAKTLVAGQHTLQIVANGHTFQRQAEHQIEVVESPVSVEVLADESPDSQMILIRLLPDQNILDIESMVVQASLSGSSGGKEELVPEFSDEVWTLKVDPPEAEERRILNISVKASSLSGQVIQPKVKPIVIDRNLLDSIGEDSEEDWEDETSEDDVELESDEEPDWILTGAITGVANLILIAGGYFVTRTIRKKLAQQQKQLIDRLAV